MSDSSRAAPRPPLTRLARPFPLFPGLLGSIPDVITMQQSVGNRAVAREVAAIQRQPGLGVRSQTDRKAGGEVAQWSFASSVMAMDNADGEIQRRIERGSGTGWGGIFWVTGGEALWNAIDKGFNTDLFALQSELREKRPKTPAVVSALQNVEKLIQKWDGRTRIFYEANPGEKQPISAAELSELIRTSLENGREALAAAKMPAPKKEPEPLPIVTETKKPRAKLTPKQTVRGVDAGNVKVPDIPLESSSDETTKVTPEPVVSIEPELVVEPTTMPVELTVTRPSKQSKPSAPKKQSQKEIEAERIEERRLANLKKKANTEKRQLVVTEFGTKLEKQTSSLLASEKIYHWRAWQSELEQLVKVAKSHPDAGKAVRKLYDSWTAALQKQRAANELERRGTKEQWQTWTGLDDYRVIEDLPGAQFSPGLPPPTEGPETAQGEGPQQQQAGDPIPIHVTYDRDSVKAPSVPINGLTAPAVTDLVLRGPAEWQRIHASLEVGANYPHVYWGGGDLGLGVARYPQQWNRIPDGYTPGPEGPFAKPKVEQVLNDYVDDIVIPSVERHVSSLMFTVYAWPEFEALAPAAAKEEAADTVGL